MEPNQTISTGFNENQLAMVDPALREELQAGRINEVMVRLNQIAKDHDIVIVTPTTHSLMRGGRGYSALRRAEDGLFWIPLEFPDDHAEKGLERMIQLHNLKPRGEFSMELKFTVDVETDVKPPGKNNPLYMLYGASRIGKTAAQEEYRRGGFASVQMETDVRSRSERRGHKPKKQLKGQDYLALRKGY